MESSFFAVSLGLLLISPLVLSEINIDLNYDSALKDVMGKKFDVKGTISLECKVTATENEKFSVKWEKDNQEVKNKAESTDRFTEEYEGNSYKIKISKAAEEDAGTYSCIVIREGEEVKRLNVTLSSRFRVKTTSNLNFVEGEIIRIPCAVYGKPTPEVAWKIGNETYTESRDRIFLETDKEKQIEKAVLVIKEANMGDRGIYTCIATTEDNRIIDESPYTSETMVRIKDKYAALWPFLGICAEVFILCAIILIYEKKRNKAELEESDTDQSPDQKNTPDHGKDSNLRHRQ